MFLVILLLGVSILVVFGALRIILGWILPPTTMHRIDQAIGTVLGVFVKLCVVVLAGIILYAVYSVARER